MTTTTMNDTLAALEARGRELQKLSFNALCMRIAKATGEIPMHVKNRLRRLGHTATVAAALRSEIDPEAEKRFVASRRSGVPTLTWGDMSLPEAALRTGRDESDADRVARLQQAIRDAFGFESTEWPGDLVHFAGHLAEEALESHRAGLARILGGQDPARDSDEGKRGSDLRTAVETDAGHGPPLPRHRPE